MPQRAGEGTVSRRRFLRTSAWGALTAGMMGPSGDLWAGAGPAVQGTGDMPYRMLGKTGARVSILGLGGHHMARPATVQEAVRIARSAVDEGINFFDNAWEYHNGRAEEWMGEALRDGYRGRVFLMTKVCARDADGAMRQIEESLRRLRTGVTWRYAFTAGVAKAA